MFWEIFVKLCIENHTKPNPVAKQLGIPSGSLTDWKNGSTPRDTTLQKIATHFNVTVNYLLGKEEKLLPLGRIVEREEDELWAKIISLDATDRIKAESFVSGLLAADKYGERTHIVRKAARGGGVEDVTLTDSQIEAIKNLPEVTNLD